MPEVDDSRPKAPAAEPLPQFDYFSFHQQGGFPTSVTDNNAANKGSQGGSLEITNPYSFNQGLASLGAALKAGREPARASETGTPAAKDGAATPAAKDGTAAPAGKDAPFTPGKKPENMICVDGICRPMAPAEMKAEEGKRQSGGKSVLDSLIDKGQFNFHQKEDSPIKLVDYRRPAADQTQPAKPADSVKELPNLAVPGAVSGKSAIVDAYERRQGARQAGGGSLPAIDAIPNDLRPPGPGNDLAPWMPPRDNTNPGTNPGTDRVDPSAVQVKHIESAEDFQKEVLESKVPVIVDFYATWCGPCQRLAPKLSTLASESGGKIKVVKVNAESLGDLASQYKVSGYPTMIFMDRGQQVGRTSGDMPKSQLIDVSKNLQEGKKWSDSRRSR